MTKVTMPVPFGWLIDALPNGMLAFSRQDPTRDMTFIVNSTASVFTATQMDAYAAAKVREALEEAARRCVESPMMNTDVYCGGTARLCADRIRALIQN